MKKYFLIVVFFFLAACPVLAKEITYPVAELGNCENKEDCKVYCDKEENMEACLSFAEKNNLMDQEEIALAKKMASGDEGPGGCEGKDECEKYCDDISNIDECVSYAEQNNLLEPEELEEAKKVQQAIKRGVTPPPCKNKKACDNYCESSEHMEECITFAKEAGFIEGKELEDAEKMLQAIKRGVTPPPCKGKDECDEYCNSPENMEVCITFALEAGFMPEEERENAQKMLRAVKQGILPPACKGKEECDVYCQQEEHFEECLNFSAAAGFMTEEEAEMARKTGGKGPGGCMGKEECEAFCNDPANQETCFNFAKEHGLMPEGEMAQMEQKNQEFRQNFDQMPAQVVDCLNSELGADNVEGLKNGSIMPSEEIGEKIKYCFEQMGPPMPPPEGEMVPANPGMLPPEGFKPPEGGMMPPEGFMPEGEGFAPIEPAPGVLLYPENIQPPVNEPIPMSEPMPVEPPPVSEPPPEPGSEPQPEVGIIRLLLGSIKNALLF